MGAVQFMGTAVHHVAGPARPGLASQAIRGGIRLATRSRRVMSLHPPHEPRPIVVEDDAAARQAVVQVVWTLTALAFGKPAPAAEAEAAEHMAYRIVLARRIARITAGALLLAASFGLGAIAVCAPSTLTAATVTTWLAGLLMYAVVRVAVAVRGELARRRGDPLAVSKDGARFRAYRLQNASTFVPYVGTLATFVLPLGWMVDSLGAGAVLSALAMMASAVVVYGALRAVLDRELAELGIDAVGGRR
jgi:hypothetical protein